jgi:ABC-2 type transport system ATP-binding protein
LDAIQTGDLSKRFRRVHALRELNLQVPEGAVYALMGPNGAGKTTLIKLLMNLMSPTVGEIFVLGANAGYLEGKNLERVGYVSENQRLLDWMSVGRFLDYCRPFYPTWDRDLEQRLIRRFDLPLNRRLKHLSRGMKMKAALTSALAFHPRLIVLDEPLSGLDPLVRDDLMESLRELSTETTVLLSSHDLAEIESFASHVGYMDGGRLLLSESMPNLRAKFRKVQAVSQSPLTGPETPPAEWRQFAVEGSTASWMETAYDSEQSTARAHQLLGPAQLSSAPMTLREVFLTMAHAGRAAQPEGELE